MIIVCGYFYAFCLLVINKIYLGLTNDIYMYICSIRNPLPPRKKLFFPLGVYFSWIHHTSWRNVYLSCSKKFMDNDQTCKTLPIPTIQTPKAI